MLLYFWKLKCYFDSFQFLRKHICMEQYDENYLNLKQGSDKKLYYSLFITESLFDLQLDYIVKVIRTVLRQ
jgi:hypothetical protein